MSEDSSSQNVSSLVLESNQWRTVSPQHGDQAVCHFSAGSWLCGVRLHGCMALLRLLLGVGGLAHWRRRPHEPHFITALKHPSHTHIHTGEVRRSVGCDGTTTRQAVVPSVFGSGSRHVIKLDLPANALFVGLHGDDFTGEPLFVDAHFHQQTLIWR